MASRWTSLHVGRGVGVLVAALGLLEATFAMGEGAILTMIAGGALALLAR